MIALRRFTPQHSAMPCTALQLADMRAKLRAFLAARHG